MSGWSLGIQLIGLVALLLSSGSFQLKRRSSILTTQLISNFLWAVHFLLLGAMTGAVLNVCAAVRSYVFNKYGRSESRSPWLLRGLIGLMAGVGFLSWQGWISLIPMTAIIIATIGFWQRDEQLIRRVILISSPLWLVYGLLSGSYVGIANETISIISVLIALWRHKKVNNILTPAPVTVMAYDVAEEMTPVNILLDKK